MREIKKKDNTSGSAAPILRNKTAAMEMSTALLGDAGIDHVWKEMT